MPPKQVPFRPKGGPQSGQRPQQNRGQGGQRPGGDNRPPQGPGRTPQPEGRPPPARQGRAPPPGSAIPPGADKNPIDVPKMKPGSTIYTLATREPKDGPQHVLHPDKQKLDRGKFQVKANFFELKKHPKHLYEYSVTLGNIVLPPDSEGAQRTRSITRRDEKNSLFLALGKLKPLVALPWAHSLTSVWTTQPLSKDLGAAIEFADVAFLGKNGRQEIMNKVLLRFVAPLIEVKDQPIVSAERERSITGLNALIASAISKNPTDIFQIGANKFFYKNGWTRLDEGHAPDLLAYRGYAFSTRIANGGMFLNVNTSSSAFFAPVPLSSFMRTFGRGNLNSALPLLRGLSVRRIYDIQLGNAEDTTKVNGVDRRLKTVTEFGKPPAAQLCKFAHGKTTVAAYFSAGGLQITEPNLPCVNVGARSTASEPEKGTWLPAEYLEIVPHQLYTRLLDGPYTKNMLNVACKRPHENLYLIMQEGIPKINLQQLSPALDLVVDMTPTLVDAKRLAMPVVQYQGSTATPGPNAQWNLMSKRLIQRPNAAVDMLYVVDLSWAVGGRPLFPQAHQKVYHDLANALKGHGVQIPVNPNFNEVLMKCPLPRENFMDVLDHFFNPKDWEIPPTRQTFMLIVLPDDSPPLYSAVKTLCDSKHGLNTICAVQFKVTKRDVASYMSNIALKFTFKLGGDVHRLPGLEGIRKKGTIVMGADVTHPQAGSLHGCPSIAAVVGTVDDQFMRFPGSMRLNPSRQEPIRDLEDMVLERLMHWSSVNKTIKPSSILFYRDGVSESQYAEIQAGEVKAIKSAYVKFVKQKKPNATAADCTVALTFVVVGKRHNTRFFPAARDQHQNESKGNTNVKPGFVVDSKIVSEANFDFYLQSHQAIKGTARPAHYIMLENGMNMTSSQLHNLTHNFCYAYARATLGVSYCTPAYYADRLCERGRSFLRPWLVPDPAKTSKEYMYQRDNKIQGAEVKIAQEKWKTTIIQRIEKDDRWNPSYKLNSVRKNPWHPNMDNIMFYL